MRVVVLCFSVQSVLCPCPTWRRKTRTIGTCWPCDMPRASPVLAGEWPVAQNGKSPAPGPTAIKSRAGTHISLGRRFLQPEKGDHTRVFCLGVAVINREAENGPSCYLAFFAMFSHCFLFLRQQEHFSLAGAMPAIHN